VAGITTRANDHLVTHIAAVAGRYPRLAAIHIMPYYSLGRDRATRLGYADLLPGIPGAGPAEQTRWLATLRELGCSSVQLG
jgi:hypothetical protein